MRADVRSRSPVSGMLHLTIYVLSLCWQPGLPSTFSGHFFKFLTSHFLSPIRRLAILYLHHGNTRPVLVSHSGLAQATLNGQNAAREDNTAGGRRYSRHRWLHCDLPGVQQPRVFMTAVHFDAPGVPPTAVKGPARATIPSECDASGAGREPSAAAGPRRDAATASTPAPTSPVVPASFVTRDRDTTRSPPRIHAANLPSTLTRIFFPARATPRPKGAPSAR